MKTFLDELTNRHNSLTWLRAITRTLLGDILFFYVSSYYVTIKAVEVTFCDLLLLFFLLCHPIDHIGWHIAFSPFFWLSYDWQCGMTYIYIPLFVCLFTKNYEFMVLLGNMKYRLKSEDDSVIHHLIIYISCIVYM